MCFQSLPHPPPLREKHSLKPSQLSVFRKPAPLKTAPRGYTSSATPGPAAGASPFRPLRGRFCPQPPETRLPIGQTSTRARPPGSCKAASLLTSGRSLRDGPRGRARQRAPVGSQPVRSGVGEPSDSEARPEGLDQAGREPFFVHSERRRGRAAPVAAPEAEVRAPRVLSSASSARRRSFRPPVTSRLSSAGVLVAGPSSPCCL